MDGFDYFGQGLKWFLGKIAFFHKKAKQNGFFPFKGFGKEYGIFPSFSLLYGAFHLLRKFVDMGVCVCAKYDEVLETTTL